MARPPRLNAGSYTGRRLYFVTFSTFERQPFLNDRETAGKLREQLLQSSRAHDIAVDAYMFMPDHVHLLLRGLTETAEMTAFVAGFKHDTGWEFRRDRRRRLWRDGFHDRVLRDESDALSVLAYLVANPVRAGLVSSPAEYEFWGSLTQTREEILERVRGNGGG